MKTPLSALLLLTSLVAVSAQDTIYAPAEAISPAVPSVVYQGPVVYQAPVLYQMPVVYNGPVFYVASAAQAMSAFALACSAPSTVTYIGGNAGAVSCSHFGFPGSQVIHFGSAQAYSQGYYFSGPR